MATLSIFPWWWPAYVVPKYMSVTIVPSNESEKLRPTKYFIVRIYPGRPVQSFSESTPGGVRSKVPCL
jgi:hypothetical protein